MKTNILFLISILSSFITFGQSIFTNPITGVNPNTSNPYTSGQIINANITVSGIGRGSGISSSNANNRYTAAGWSTSTLDLNDYFEFTLSPNSNFAINFVSFAYSSQVSTGTASHFFRSSLDGFTSNIGTPTTTGTTISLSAASYQAIGAPITFRFYTYGISAGTTTFSINDFTFNGTVSSTTASPVVIGSSEIGTVGSVYNYFVNTLNSPTSYAIVSGSLPPGLVLNTSTGQISGSPTTIGSFSIDITATNNVGTSAVATISFVISSYVPGCYLVDFNTAPYKNGYPSDVTTLNGKIWNLSESLVGGTNTAQDFGLSTYCLRMRSNSESAATLIQDKSNGISTVAFDYKKYSGAGTYTNQVFNVDYSKDGGNSWINIGNVAPSTTTTTTFNATVNQAGPIRFRIVFASGTEDNNVRINIDNINICDFLSTKEIEVYGNSTSIGNNSVITSENNNTNFSTAFYIGNAPIEKTFVITNNGSGVLNLSGLLLSTSPFFSITSGLSSSSLASGQSAIFKITFTGTSTGLKTASVTISNDDADESTFNFSISANVFNHVKCTLLASSILAQNDFDSNVGYTYVSGSSNANTSIAGGTGYGNNRITTSNMFIGTNSFQSKTNLNRITFATVNTLNYQNLELNFNLGAFAATTTEGIETSDYAEISISIDGGITFTPQIRITGNNNSIFDINNSLAINSSNYKPNSTNPTRFATLANSTNSTSSIYKIKSLPSVSDLRVRVTFVSNNASEIWAIDNISIKGQLPLNTLWDGTSWLQGAPTNSTKAIINNNYNTLTNGDIIACECQLNTGFTLTVDSNISTKTFLESQGKIDNNGTILVADGSSVVQVNDEAINTGTGTYSVFKKSTPYVEYDYTFWSSPINYETFGSVLATNPSNYIFGNTAANFLDLYSFSASGGTGFPQISGTPDTFDDSGDDWIRVLGSDRMFPAKGYVAMGNPADASTGQSVVFTETGTNGALNNGVIPIAVTKDKYTTDGLTGANSFHTNGNLIGNPYASAIDLVKLTADNSLLTGTYYFWTHKTPITLANPGPWAFNFTNNDYVTFTVGTGGSNSSCSGCPIPDRYVDSCQSFFANVNGNGNVTFNNSQRVSGNNASFYRPSNSVDDKIWLNFSASNGETRQILVGFVAGAEDEYNPYYDGARMENGTGFDFYSYIPSDPQQRLAVQGLSAFNTDKTVPLGVEITENGTHKISIDHFEGVFNSSQGIYLQDNLTNTIHDFADGEYVFTSEVGDAINNRFLLRFTNPSLGISENEMNQNNINIFSINDKTTIKSKIQKIQKIMVYDILGRELLIAENLKVLDYSFSNSNWNKQALIVKIILENGTIVSKKIIN